MPPALTVRVLNTAEEITTRLGSALALERFLALPVGATMLHVSRTRRQILSVERGAYGARVHSATVVATF